MKLFLTIFFISAFSLLNGQNNQLPDPFETEGEKNYRLNHPNLKPDSNYTEYWCSIEILKNINNNLDQLSLTQIAELLATFHPSCNSNVEFSEWSNELLFQVLEKYPKMVLQVISKNNSLYRNQIAEELKNPVVDFDQKTLVSKLEMIDNENQNRARDIILSYIKEK